MPVRDGQNVRSVRYSAGNVQNNYRKEEEYESYVSSGL
jgi:hypothetical protein